MRMLLLFLACALPSAFVQAAEVVPDPFAPAQLLSLYIEKRADGKITSIQLVGDGVVYKVMVKGKAVEESTAHPTDDDWFKFIQALNTAKVYKWAPKFYYPGRGTNWIIDLAMADRQFGSNGTNEFPKEGDEGNGQADPKAGESVPFRLMWQAALQLAGKKPEAQPTETTPPATNSGTLPQPPAGT